MNDHELDQLLKASNRSLATPSGFQHAVWSRIEASDTPHPPRFLELVLAFFAKPGIAFATCTATIVLGVWMGTKEPQTRTTGKLAYVQAVSPFAHTHR